MIIFNKKYIPVSEPNLKGKELEYITDAIKSTWISSTGKYINEFEKIFAEYVRANHAISVSNGTVALHLALLALNIGPGDEVIVPNLTYIATANSVTYVGATPVFADSEKDTWNIDPKSIERLLTKKTKAIIPVHLYGNPCNMNEIIKIAKTNNLFVIEDSAEALGSEYFGQKTGSFGDISTFSFYGNKTITTGEGGMVVTNDREIANKLKILKGQGMNPNRRYWFDIIGYNYRMTNMQAAIGCAQMERVDELVRAKRNIAKLYHEYLMNIPDITIPIEKIHTKNTYWMYSIVLNNYCREKREKFREELEKLGIETRPFFYLITEMPPYNKHKSGECKIAKLLADKGINLPSSTILKEEEIEYICRKVKKCLKEL